MFIATALLYPCALALLCLGAGLLVDHACGRLLPAALLPAVGAAALIALSQLTTFIPALAPATPYAIAVLAVAGLWLARARLALLVSSLRRSPARAAAPVLVYALALAPVLLAGRASFSSFMALADSAVHMAGADYLIHHGQSYAHLDLHSSYGQFINDYYNTSYPSGADTLFGGSAILLRLPLIWAFQPFNAFMLATAYGPAWLLARRLRLDGVWAHAAALTVVLPALVYGYELLGSVKEVTALSMLLTSGCLVAAHRRWLGGDASAAAGGGEERGGEAAGAGGAVAGAIPLALVLAAGISALGVAFGVWALAAVAVLAVVLGQDLLARRIAPARALAMVAAAALAGVVAALPSFTDLSGSVQVASNIASTGNAGNLHSPLRAIQVFGVWLADSYKAQPAGSSLLITHLLIALAFACALVGVAHVLRTRAFALAGWLALMLLAWLIVSREVTTWANAKTLMLSSPIVVLLVWAGIALLRTLRLRALGAPAAALVALSLLAGVLVSDAKQYHAANLAPTARYRELAAVNSRFAGRGPAIVTDFDEYSLYVLRDLDIAGPDFVYPPAALAPAAGGYGNPVDLARVAPSALAQYPLIITRRDPSAPRPPSAYGLAWQGSYYQVWSRRPGAAVPLAHVALAGSSAARCARISALARSAPAGSTLVGAGAPQLVRVSLALATHPPRWGHERDGLVMKHAGTLSARFRLPSAGNWEVWVRGQFMPSITLAVDGRTRASISGQLSGNSLVQGTPPPTRIALSAGAHTLALTRGGFTLGPGNGGAAVVAGIFLTPASAAAQDATLRVLPAARAQQLCGSHYEWVELFAGSPGSVGTQR
jgi:hypothetical protein